MKRWENTKLILAVCKLLLLIDGSLSSSDSIECFPKKGSPGLGCSFIGNFSEVQSLQEEVYSSNVTLNSIAALKLQNIIFKSFSVKSSFYKLDNLKQMVINNCSGLNNLKNMEFDIKLESIEVTHCGVEEAGEASFRNLLRLVELKLNNNLIASLHEKAFELNKLESLDLSFNRISWLPERIFHNCANLRYLKLSSNFIREIPAMLFAQNEVIVEIILRNNKIVAIERSDRPTFKLLEKFDLKGNFCSNESFNISSSTHLILIQNKLKLCYVNYEMLLHTNQTIQQIKSESDSPEASGSSEKGERNLRPSRIIKDDPAPNWERNIQEEVTEEAPTGDFKNNLTRAMNNEALTAVTVSSVSKTDPILQCWLISLSISASTLLIVAVMLYLSHRQLKKSSFNDNIPVSSYRHESKV